MSQPTSDITRDIMIRCKTDFPFYAEKFLKILTMGDDETGILTFNKPQMVLHQIVENIKKVRPVRLIALKARRMGFSTYFSARYYHKTTWTPKRKAMQITHEPQASDELFKMVKRFYDSTPVKLQPALRANNARLMDFNTKDGKGGLDSSFRVATAGKDDVGSGQLIHFLHLSEVAKYPAENATSLLTAVLQCVPRTSQDAEIVMESTACGLGGEFYDRFWNARYRVWVSKLDEDGTPLVEEVVNENAPPSNNYTSIFLPWFLMEIYELDPPDNPKERILTEEEEKIKKQFGLSDRQIYWRRDCIANNCNNDIETFNQEYPSDPMCAFIGGGRPVFNTAELQRLKMAAPLPIKRYSCMPTLGTWRQKDDGELRVWEEPNLMSQYIIAADVAEAASATSDFSSADVIDHITGKQVAQWHGRIAPKLFAEILYYLGMRYATALLVVETAGGGGTVLSYLQDQNYPRIYWREHRDPPFRTERKMGFSTNSATRPMLLDNLMLEFDEGTTGIRCAETFDEMMSFRYQKDGKPQADAGRFDDRVMSIAIAKFVRSRVQLPKRQPVNSYSPPGQRRRSAAGWT